MAIERDERRSIDRQFSIKGNFTNARLVNPHKKNTYIHDDVYALDPEHKLHKVGQGRIVKKGYGHTYWQAGGMLTPVHWRANHWVLSNTNRPLNEG